MSATTADLDLADLDLLDDPTRHVICTVCAPDYRPGLPVLALCGRRVVSLQQPSREAPADVCPDCTDLAPRPCRICSTRAYDGGPR